MVSLLPLYQRLGINTQEHWDQILEVEKQIQHFCDLRYMYHHANILKHDSFIVPYFLYLKNIIIEPKNINVSNINYWKLLEYYNKHLHGVPLKDYIKLPIPGWKKQVDIIVNDFIYDFVHKKYYVLEYNKKYENKDYMIQLNYDWGY